MSTPESIDVIIPTYNGMPWLRKTVDSVMAQTHKNFQLYIVDDGSTDNTAAYAKSLGDKRVHFIKKANGGQATARNLGVQQSDSPFVAFLDADDIWYPEKLEKQLAVMKAHPKVGMVYGHHYIIDEDDIITGNLRHSERGDLFDTLCKGNIIAGSASMVLVRREIINQVGPFHEDFLIGEDWDMWLRIAKVCDIDLVPEIIAALRTRGDGMQQNHKKMADGLVHNYFAMKQTLGLNRRQQAALAGYSLFHAAVGYMAAGDRGKARQTLFKLFREDPGTIKNLQNWKLHTAFGIFSKVIFGNPLFDLLRRIWHFGWHSLRRLIAFPAKAARKAIRRIK